MPIEMDDGDRRRRRRRAGRNMVTKVELGITAAAGGSADLVEMGIEEQERVNGNMGKI